jgi:hypothetical protein
MPSFARGNLGPQQFSQSIAPVGTGLHGEVDQKSEMLPGAKTDRFAGGGEEGGLTQATEVPLRFHCGSHMQTDMQSMQAAQLIVNKLILERLCG